MMKNYALLFFFFLFGASFVCSAQETVPESSKDEESAIQDLSDLSALDSFKLNEAVTMFPNPVQHYLTIQSNIPITRVQVYSLLGQLVKDVPSNFLRIYMGDLNSGIYMIKIYSNEYYITKKLVKR